MKTEAEVKEALRAMERQIRRTRSATHPRAREVAIFQECIIDALEWVLCLPDDGTRCPIEETVNALRKPSHHNGINRVTQDQQRKRWRRDKRRYVRARRLRLIKRLGGKCVECGTEDEKKLELDHTDARGWVAREIWSPKRLRIY